MTINIIIPVLNEEKDLEKNIKKVCCYLNKTELLNNYHITIIDNGSYDKTQIISQKIEQDSTYKISYIRLEERGVGLAFREGIKCNKSDIVGYMDLDLATDLKHLVEVYKLFQEKQAEIVIGSRLLRKSNVIGRTLKREVTSRGLNFILKILLKVKFSDAMCGFKFYKAEMAEQLVTLCSNSNGWFYCAEMLIRAGWDKIRVHEIPVTWTDDPNSKVNIGKLSLSYLKEIKCLYLEKRSKNIL